MNLKDIVLEYLVAHGYDGLCNEHCGCRLSGLMPCEGVDIDACEPGYRAPNPYPIEGPDWIIQSTKPEAP